MKPNMSLKIKEEVKKKFDIGFLAMAQYPEWVANIMPVPKKDGREGANVRGLSGSKSSQSKG